MIYSFMSCSNFLLLPLGVLKIMFFLKKKIQRYQNYFVFEHYGKPSNRMDRKTKLKINYRIEINK